MSSENLDSISSSKSWYSWLKQAKNVTASTFDCVKKDLEEFGTALSEQTSSTVGTIKNHIPKMDSSWVKRVMNTVNDALNFEDEENHSEEKLNIPKVSTNGIQRSSSRLFAIQSDPNTYCDEPPGAPELFEDWLDHFNLQDKVDNIRDLLLFNTVVRRLFAELVPKRVSNKMFWRRYFYKVHQLELDECRRRNLKQMKKERLLRLKQAKERNDSWNSDFGEIDLNGIDLSATFYNNRTCFSSSKSKSTSDISNISKFARRHKSPSLDIEIKEAELLAQGLTYRTASCSSLDGFPYFESPEDHTNYCRSLCHSFEDSIEWD